MQRYFFHMASKNQKITDEIGREMDLLRAAHKHAIGLIIKATTYLNLEDTKGWRYQIANSSGDVEMVVLFPVRFIHQSHRSLFSLPA